MLKRVWLAVGVLVWAVAAVAAAGARLRVSPYAVKVDGDPREAFLLGALPLPMRDAVTGRPDGSVRAYALATREGLYVALLSTEPDGGRGLMRPLPWAPPQEWVLGDWMAVRLGEGAGTRLFLMVPGAMRTVLDGEGLPVGGPPPWRGAESVFGRTWAGEWLVPWASVPRESDGRFCLEVLRGRKVRADGVVQESLSQSSAGPASWRWGGRGLRFAVPSRFPEAAAEPRALKPYDVRPYIPAGQGAREARSAAPAGQEVTAWLEVPPGEGKITVTVSPGLEEVRASRLDFWWQAGRREEIDALFPVRVAAGMGDVLVGERLFPEPEGGFEAAGEPLRIVVRGRISAAADVGRALAPAASTLNVHRSGRLLPAEPVGNAGSAAGLRPLQKSIAHRSRRRGGPPWPPAADATPGSTPGGQGRPPLRAGDAGWTTAPRGGTRGIDRKDAAATKALQPKGYARHESPSAAGLQRVATRIGHRSWRRGGPPWPPAADATRGSTPGGQGRPPLRAGDVGWAPAPRGGTRGIDCKDAAATKALQPKGYARHESASAAGLRPLRMKETVRVTIRVFREGHLIAAIPWTITVAPPLPTPSRLVGAYYFERDASRWASDLRDLADHGVTAVTCPARDGAGWTRFQEEASKAGLDGRWALHPDAVPEGEAAWGYVADEPATVESIGRARARALAAKARGLKPWAALAWPDSLGLASVLDGVAVPPNLAGQARTLGSAHRWVYVQGLRESPFYNRVWAGLLARAPGLDGLWVFCYAPAGDGPADDWAGPMIRYDALVDPDGEGGRLDTVQFEALRAGIVDGRLLDALGPARAKAVLARFPGALEALKGEYWRARDRGWSFPELRQALVAAWAGP